MHVVDDVRSDPLTEWPRRHASEDEPHDATALQPSRRDRPFRTEAPPRAGARRPAAGRRARRAGAAAVPESAYALDVTEENLQTLLDASMTAPVVLVFYSAAQAPESADDGRRRGHRGRRVRRALPGRLIDIDASPAIAQAMQIPQVPMLFVLLDGRPAAQPIPGVLTLDELRTLFNQLAQQLTAQGITGRHQPRTVGPAAGGDEDRGAASTRATRPPRTPSVRATSTLAVAEYQKLVDANPADAEAAAGLAMAKVLQRTQGVDLQAARAAARGQPRRRGRADHGRRPRHARRPRGRRVHPPGRPGTPHRRRRPQQGPRAPARPLRGRRQRRPAGPHGRQSLASALF